jgi:hypothetical protein
MVTRPGNAAGRWGTLFRRMFKKEGQRTNNNKKRGGVREFRNEVSSRKEHHFFLAIKVPVM